ncbi:S1C family serine protease [Deinococcus sp.]|uniref:S1C family serine protease n=1 Tax=Deinococcus sp. TaxID=47478 RepID=UPI0025C4D21A|nr:S1C family serine protease [Deinococcus sp.]
MRRPKLLLPALLLLSLWAYIVPAHQPSTSQGTPSPSPVSPSLPGDLPPETMALFGKVRPATVQVESLNVTENRGGLGTGFFIDAGGHVLTAYHVVSTGQLFQVRTLSGTTLPARVMGFDARRDVALLQVGRGGPFPFLKLTTRTPRLGESVLAVGNSHGDFLQPRRGQLLRLNVEAGRADFPEDTMELSAPLAPGDSGGPIIDASGRATGVISYIRESAAGATQASYAVPLMQGSELMRALLRGEKRDTPVAGLVLDPTHSGQTDPPGAVVAHVVAGSPAEKAGLRGCAVDQNGNLKQLGDVIVQVNGTATPDANAFIRVVENLQIGQRVSLTYIHDGRQLETTLTLAARRDVRGLNDPSRKGPC